MFKSYGHALIIVLIIQVCGLSQGGMQFIQPPELSGGSALQKVAMLVDSELYPELAGDIERYERDVEAHFPVDILVYQGAYRTMTFEQVRAELQGIWRAEGISGIILTGYFPIMMYHVKGQGLRPMGQIMGYEDLDGWFTDEGYYADDGQGMVFYSGSPDGVYDHHYWNNNGMEAWCAVIRPYLTQESYTTEARQQLHEFFFKSHAYYNGELVIPRRGLGYVDRDWRSDGSSLDRIFNDTYGAGNSVVYAGGRNCGFRYMEERASGFEIAYLYSHSSSWFHQFDRGPWHDVQNTELIEENGRGAVITYGFNCHGADFLETPSGCMGQRYVFGSELGQAYVGCMISTGVIGIIEQAERLRDGEYLGQAFYRALNSAYQHHQGFDSTQSHGTIWAQVILGNPFVTAAVDKNWSARPGSIAGRVVGGQEVRLTVMKDGKVYGVGYSRNGTYLIDCLSRGHYTIRIETRAGDPAGYLTVDLESGQALTGQDIVLPNYGARTNLWYYFYQTSDRELPAGWNSAAGDMNLWDGQGAAPIGYDEEVQLMGGTSVNRAGDSSGTVYARKAFICSNVGQYQRVWVYGMVQNGQMAQVWVNGHPVEMTPIENRTALTYWTGRGDITGLVHEGSNYIVASGKEHLDIAAPVYRTDDLNDDQPPIPNPAGFIRCPEAVGTRSVVMEAQTVEDEYFGVEYYFECVGGAGRDSGWQSSPIYTDNSLQPGGFGVYRVKGRDTSNNHNETEYSQSFAVSTYEQGAAPSEVYDGMEYGAGTTDHSYGWSGGWNRTSVNGTTEAAPFGLGHAGLLTEGNCLHLSAVKDTPSEVNERKLRTGYSSGTVWLSALVGADKIGNGHFFIVPTSGFDGAVGKRWGSKFAINNNSSSLTMERNRTYLLAARYDLGSGNDRISLWINPPLDHEPQVSEALVVKEDRNVGVINGVVVNLSGWGGGSFYVDEIRLSRRWEDVIARAEYICSSIPEYDLNGDCRVDFEDIMIMTNLWLTDSVWGTTDLAGFNGLAAYWMDDHLIWLK